MISAEMIDKIAADINASRDSIEKVMNKILQHGKNATFYGTDLLIARAIYARYITITPMGKAQIRPNKDIMELAEWIYETWKMLNPTRTAPIHIIEKRIRDVMSKFGVSTGQIKDGLENYLSTISDPNYLTSAHYILWKMRSGIRDYPIMRYIEQ